MTRSFTVCYIVVVYVVYFGSYELLFDQVWTRIAHFANHNLLDDNCQVDFKFGSPFNAIYFILRLLLNSNFITLLILVIIINQMCKI